MSRVLVVGGGAVGLFTAWYLQRKGAEVTVIERTDMNDGCSYGNAGLIVPSHVVPFASPEMFRKGVKNLFKSSSPVAARMGLNPDLLHWYMRFAGVANQEHVQRSIPVLKEISLLSKSLYADLKAKKELDFPYWQKGLLMLYKSQRVGVELLHEAEIARQAGLKVSELSMEDVHKLEPDTLPDVSGGVHYHSDDHLDPHALMKSLQQSLTQSGVRLISECELTGIDAEYHRATSVQTTKGCFEFDSLVITAGMWSLPILKQLNTRILVQPGKGYSFKTTTAAPIHYPALLSDANVAVTPLGNGITQFGGGMEVGYGDLKIRQARVHHVVKSVGEFYSCQKNMELGDKVVWQGHRPCSFDGLPFIGKLRNFNNVFVGTGHSMMGITLATATGLLLSELISGEKTTIDLTPFRIER